MTIDSARHWNDVWDSKRHEETSWFQPAPATSLAMLDDVGVGSDDIVIEVGCGASYLADQLLDRGVAQLHLLDISSAALAKLRARLDLRPEPAPVTWHRVDILDLDPVPQVSVWHDRAVLHFLRDPAARGVYARIAARAVRPGGHLVVSGFAPDGPARCSDLEVQRADEQAIGDLFATDFDLVDGRREVHRTPWGSEQSFQWCLLRRRDVED